MNLSFQGIREYLDFIFLGCKIAAKSLQMVTVATKLKDTSFLEEKLSPRQRIKKQTLLCQQTSV